VLVYGEFIQSPQVLYAHLLSQQLPASLDSVYFTNSGAEAVEGAMKLAKRATGRTQIIAFKNSYHGSTQGALSIIGDEYWRNAFRPLLPGILHLEYNAMDSLNHIHSGIACVIAETVQAESGLHAPSAQWMQALRKRCDEEGVLLVLDEIQAGFGRTGRLWGFEHFGIVPDILLLGKALGGGMPLGAFIANRELMQCLTDNPVLGHITTFGGHPVCCAAGMAAFKALLEEDMTGQAKAKENVFRERLQHKKIKALRSFGLWLALEFDSFETNKKVIGKALEKGVLTDWFLFAPHCLRIAPPLVISEKEIEHACEIITDCL
jgi:acetylornithine/succinyldiaminopimelate/putrescine aminotransferase